MIMGMCIGCSPYNAEQSVITQAIAVLRRFGTDAHVYLPGVGMLNGLQAVNYLDSAGTQAGEVDQPVGLVLDAAGGLGVELYSFANVSAAGALTSVTSGFTFDGSGQLAGDAGQRSSVNFPTVIGLTYKFVLRINSGSMTSPGAGFFIRAGVNGMGTILHSVSAPVQKIHEAVLVAQSTTTSILFDSAIDFSIYTIDNLSVREVTGIAASQPTTSAKPILRRGAVNLLTYSGDFSNAAWSKVNCTSLGEVATTTASGAANFSQGNAAFVAGVTVTAARVVKAGSINFATLGAFGDKDAYFNLTDGTVQIGTAGVNAPTASMVSIGNGYYLCAATWVKSSATTTIFFAHSDGYMDQNVPAGSTLLCQAQGAFQGTYTAAQIQALGGIPTTTTAPASTALGPYSWGFDGINDSLSLGSVPFQMGDDHWVVAVGSVGKLSANQSFFGGCTNTGISNPVVCDLELNTTGGGKFLAFWRDDSGAAKSLIGSSTPAVGAAFVVSARKIASAVSLRVNGVSEQESTFLASTTTVNIATIGATTRVSSSNFVSGNIYPIAFGKGTITDADLLLIEKALGQMAGVTI